MMNGLAIMINVYALMRRVPKNVGQCYERREEVCNIVLLKHKLCSLQNTPLQGLFGQLV